MKNFFLKLFSLLVAMLLFMFVRSESNTSTADLMLPIEISNIPSDTVIIAPKERSVRVTIKGPTSFVNRIVTSPPVLKFKLPPGISTRYVISLRKIAVPIPSYVQIQRIEPADLELTFDKIITKEVQVSVPMISGETTKISELKIQPSKVTVRGPLSELRGVKKVETYPLDLREVTRDFERDLPLRAPGGTLLGTLIEVSPSSVHVTTKAKAPELASTVSP